VLAVVNPKGGSGKTTASAFAAKALAEQRHPDGRPVHHVLAVDADPEPESSLFEWQRMAGLPFGAAKLAVPTLYRELPRHVGPSVSAVVIDTPGTAVGRPIMLGAIRAATHVLVPLAPGPADYGRLRTLRTILDEALGRHGARPVVAVLMVKVRSPLSHRTWRNQAIDDGWRVLKTSVPLWETYAQALGSPIVNASATGYGDAVAELLTES
jgi:chromosome partitioning protein